MQIGVHSWETADSHEPPPPLFPPQPLQVSTHRLETIYALSIPLSERGDPIAKPIVDPEPPWQLCLASLSDTNDSDPEYPQTPEGSVYSMHSAYSMSPPESPKDRLCRRRPSRDRPQPGCIRPPRDELRSLMHRRDSISTSISTLNTQPSESSRSRHRSSSSRSSIMRFSTSTATVSGRSSSSSSRRSARVPISTSPSPAAASSGRSYSTERTSERSNRNTRSQGRPGRLSSKANLETSVQALKVSPARSEVTAMAAQPFRGYEQRRDVERSADWEPLVVCSLKEGDAIDMERESQPAWIAHNRSNLSRVYPKGSRMDSSNMADTLLCRLWGAGVQMAALNFQTFDQSSMLNEVRGLRELSAQRDGGECSHMGISLYGKCGLNVVLNVGTEITPPPSYTSSPFYLAGPLRTQRRLWLRAQAPPRGQGSSAPDRPAAFGAHDRQCARAAKVNRRTAGAAALR